MGQGLRGGSAVVMRQPQPSGSIGSLRGRWRRFRRGLRCYLPDRSTHGVTKSAPMGRGDRLDITDDLADPGVTRGDPDTVTGGTGVGNDQPVQWGPSAVTAHPGTPSARPPRDGRPGLRSQRPVAQLAGTVPFTRSGASPVLTVRTENTSPDQGQPSGATAGTR
jgi:hypothetical protein